MPIEVSAMYCCPANRSRTASTPSMPGFFVTKSHPLERASSNSTFGRIVASFSARPNDAFGRRASTVRSGSDMLSHPSDTATEPSQPLWILAVSASATFLRPCSPFTTVVVMGEPPASIPDRFNAAAFFADRHMVDGRAGRPALYHEDRVVTYGVIFETVNRVGNALLDLGVQMEDRVLLILLHG